MIRLLASQRSAAALLLLAVLAVVGIILLAALGQPIPDVLEQLGYASLTGGAAAAVPTSPRSAADGAGSDL